MIGPDASADGFAVSSSSASATSRICAERSLELVVHVALRDRIHLEIRSEPDRQHPRSSRRCAAGKRQRGEVMVAWKVTMFKKIKYHTHENVGWGSISIPEQEMHTTACWLVPPAELGNRYDRDTLDGALIGIARVARTTASLLLMCDPRDVGVLAQVQAPFTGRLPVTWPRSVAQEPINVGDASYDDWEVVRDFDDLETARAWRQQLTDAGHDVSERTVWRICSENGVGPTNYCMHHSGSAVGWLNTTNVNSDFHLAEGCAAYLAVITAAGNVTVTPDVSVTYNPASSATGACA